MTPVYKLSASSVTGRTNYGSMLAGNPVFIDTAFESIATETVGSGGAATVTFSSIPATYSHLQVRIFARSATAVVTLRNITLRINSDTGANYSTHYLVGDGTTASGQADAPNISFIYIGTAAAAGATANVFGASVLDILDYANTNKTTTIKCLRGSDNNGNGQVALVSGLWNDTSAVNELTFAIESGANIEEYSHFALYGIKSA